MQPRLSRGFRVVAQLAPDVSEFLNGLVSSPVGHSPFGQASPLLAPSQKCNLAKVLASRDIVV